MNTQVIAARIKDKTELNNSSSGGLFTAISDYFFENGGAVVSAVYNYQINQNEFVLYCDKETRNKARGSKYMQAYPMHVFQEAEQWLRSNEGELLFVGTGCQADGFRRFAEKKGFRDRVTVVDIICHGTPSPKLWKDYIRDLNISYVTFKDKRNGWKKPTAFVISEGKEISISDYVALFYNKCALRPSCYECPYTSTERNSDITIGDYWGIEKVLPAFYSEEGNSLLLIHTEKGKSIFDIILDKLDYVLSNETACLQPNLIKPTERSPLRAQFWMDYKKGGIKKVLKKYGPLSKRQKVFNKVKKKLRSLWPLKHRT